MENLLQSIQNAISPVEQGIGNAAKGVGNFLSQGFNDFTQGAQQAEQAAAGAAQRVGNYLNQGFQQYMQQPQQLPLGFGIQNPINSWLAQTPAYLQQGAQAADNWIGNTFGNNIFGNAGQDIVNAGAGLLSLPGIGAQLNQNPQEAPQMLGNMGSSIINEYKNLLTNPVGHFQQHPVNSILDVLPALGLLGKLGTLGTAGEAAGTAGEAGGIATAAEGAADTAPVLSKSEALAKMDNLFNYPQQMFQRGFTPEQVDQMSAPLAKELMDEGTTPQEFDNLLKSQPSDIGRANIIAGEAQTGSPLNTLKTWLNGLNGMSQDVKDNFANWVNSRAAAPIEGMANAKNFTQYDGEGLQGILKFQEDPTQYPDLKNYFDQKYQQLKDQGIDVFYKNSYLPQLWQNEDAAQQFFNKSLNPKSAPFTFESVLKNYQEGIDAGLQPRFNTLSDLAGWYEQRANKLLADNQYFNSLRQDSLIQPSGKAPNGWQQLGTGFPTKTTTLDDGSTFSGTYSAPKQLADAINGYLQKDDGVLNAIGNVASKIKNTVLSAGIPVPVGDGTYSALNFHGLNVFIREALSSNNPFAGAWTGAKYLLNPRLAQASIDNNLQAAAQAVHAGLNLNIEDTNFFDNTQPTNLIGKAAQTYTQIFHDPIFKQVIPALKIDKWQTITDNLVKSGVDPDQAAAISARQVNTLYGGQNLQAIARSQQFQDLLRATTFAPDWLEGNIKIGVGMVKGLLQPGNPEYQVYRTFTRNLAAAYITENLTQKALTGTYTFQNPAGHTFDLDTGQYTADGKKIYLQPFGTAIDAVRLPVDMATSLVSGNTQSLVNTVRNRLSPPVAMGVDQLANQNYAGQPLYKIGASGGQQVAGRLGDIFSSTVPPQIGAAARLATGQATPGQAIAQGIQAPIRFGSGANNQTEQNMVNLLQSGGANGQQINQSLTNYKQQQAADAAFKQQMTNGFSQYSSQNQQKPSVFDTVFKWLGFPKNDPTQQPKQTNGAPASTGDPVIDAFNQQKTESANLTKIKDIFNSGLDPAGISKALAANNLGDYNSARMQIFASLSTEERAPIIQGMLQQVGNDQNTYMQTVSELAKNKILTSAVVSSWLADGTIDSNQAKTLDTAIKLSLNQSVKGFSTYTGTSTGGTTRKIGLAPLALPKPTFTTPKAFALPNFTPAVPKLQQYKSSQAITGSSNTTGNSYAGGVAPFWENQAAAMKAGAPKAQTNPFDAITKVTQKIPAFNPKPVYGGGSGFSQGLGGYSPYSSGAGFK